MSDLIKYIQEGISLDTYEPFKKIAEEMNSSEESVLMDIAKLKSSNKIKRFGPVLFNRSIGLNQNAMTTLEVAVEKIEEVGEKVAAFDFVTLCYERASIPGVWEYNLYFMIHGNNREKVESNIKEVLEALGEDVLNHKVLFSSRCFKQKGASY